VPLPGKQLAKTDRPLVAPRRFSRLRRALCGALVLLLLGSVVAWVERQPLLAWAYVQGLARAGAADRDAWAERVAGLDEAAMPGLLSCLGHGGPDTCANAEAALRRLAERWDGDPARRGTLAARLAEAFPRLGVSGQETVLRLETAWSAGGHASSAALQPLLRAAATADQTVRAKALDLAALAVDRPDPAELLADCRDLTQRCLRDAEPQARLRAIPLAVHPRLGLLEQVMLLLNDPVPEVRREAMLAARSAPETIMKTEHLLRWLHDPDEDVRRLCEAVLRGRNLSENHVRLGRMLTDERAAVRLQVLKALHADADLEPGVWLRLLSVDPEPAVRVAALRAAVADGRVDFSDRLDQMIQSDPSPTVSQLARYYLSRQKRRNSSTLPADTPR
jgi:hypothetical protein